MEDTKPVILVVGDAPDNLVFDNSLLKEKYQVKIATNGEKALALAVVQPPDLILLDVMMPVMDGYETCRWLKAQPALADVPVIFLTAKSDVADQSKGFAVGAVDYIKKPLSLPSLLSQLRIHLPMNPAQDF